jgi:hypothetical protein
LPILVGLLLLLLVVVVIYSAFLSLIHNRRTMSCLPFMPLFVGESCSSSLGRSDSGDRANRGYSPGALGGGSGGSVGPYSG